MSSYTDEQVKWLKKNYKKYGKHHITDAFNSKFNEHRSLDSVWWKVQKLGLTGNGAEYKAEMCKKHFSVPLGTEHIDSQGYVLVKVKDDKNGKSKNWETKQRVVWEQHNGKIPKGYFVTFLNNDKTDCRIENLVCIPKGVMATFAKKGWTTTTGELKKVAIQWCILYGLVGADRKGVQYKDEQLCVYGDF